MLHFVSRVLGKLNIMQIVLFNVWELCVKDNYKIARLYIEAFQFFFFFLYLHG